MEWITHGRRFRWMALFVCLVGWIGFIAFVRGLHWMNLDLG